MKTVYKEVENTGGSTIRILPSVNEEEENEWIDIPICTRQGKARHIVAVQTGLAIIAIGGAYGTLSRLDMLCRTINQYSF
jgi:uncharacterized protein (TIGR00725 family)